jgi:hypothetical protein
LTLGYSKTATKNPRVHLLPPIIFYKIADAVETRSVSIHSGLDLGEIKMHLPEEDFSWSPTLKERKYHHNSKQPPATT